MAGAVLSGLPCFYLSKELSPPELSFPVSLGAQEKEGSDTFHSYFSHTGLS